MRALSSSEFLGLWERGQRLHPLDRGLLALQAASPGDSWDALAELPLGERNRRLAELRGDCFGPRLEGWVACPECAERLEFDLDGEHLAAADFGRPVVWRGQPFRLPCSRDVACAARHPDPAQAVGVLLERCRLGPEPGPGMWSPEQMDEIGDLMSLADPLAETRLELACSHCGHRWDELLDIAAFLWTEIEAQVRRLLLEVHALASAYGWSEAEILSLGDQRRSLYLEMVRA
jgi:hypothetical protein